MDDPRTQNMTEADIQAEITTLVGNERLKPGDASQNWTLFTLGNQFNVYGSGALQPILNIFDAAKNLQDKEGVGWDAMGIRRTEGKKVICSFRRIPGKGGGLIHEKSPDFADLLVTEGVIQDSKATLQVEEVKGYDDMAL